MNCPLSFRCVRLCMPHASKIAHTISTASTNTSRCWYLLVLWLLLCLEMPAVPVPSFNILCTAVVPNRHANDKIFCLGSLPYEVSSSCLICKPLSASEVFVVLMQRNRAGLRHGSSLLSPSLKKLGTLVNICDTRKHVRRIKCLGSKNLRRLSCNTCRL